MRSSAHLRLLALATVVWVAFWIAGLPDYYQQYSRPSMVGFSAALIPAIAILGARVIGRAKAPRRMRLAFWLSFYFTVPFLLYDYLYCGWYLGHGWRFLIEYWYLTVFYFVPWLLFIPTAMFLARRPAQDDAAA